MTATRSDHPAAFADTLATGESGIPTSLDEADRLVGQELDHFELGPSLGKGGMGAVYRARDLSLDREVAIKMIRGSFASAENQERLLREARAQARLNHPNIVHIYYIGSHPATERSPATLFLAMELVEGETMEDLLERGEQLSAEQMRIAMLQVARGLRAASREGIVHRDIKPSNLLRDREGTIKIADFGLATSLGEGGGSLAGVIVGSPHYMSPEQGTGERVDHRSDMYALGATFHHLLCGHPLYDGPSPMEVIAQHVTATLPALPASVPSRLRAILLRLLAKQPEERFESYDDLIDALEQAAPEHSAHAGFWIRGAAVGIDTFIAAGLIATLGWIGILLHLAHVVVGHAMGGQTLAKYLLRIRVARVDGSALGFPRSILRMFASLWLPIFVAALTAFTEGIWEVTEMIETIHPAQMAQVQSLAIGVAISHAFLSLVYASGLGLAAFHPDKRAAHDLLCDTVVSYRVVQE
ncbi:MAG: protein kinase [Myxococcales bacterium]|nr:protein kinase [Myxococcales bacterium]